MMFQLLRYSANETGNVSVMIEYDLANGKDFRKEQDFADEPAACGWIVNVMQKYILEKVKRFIDHKKILSEVSHGWSHDERKPAKLKDLQLCIRECMAMREYELDSVCTIILSMEEYLRNILPLEHQKDFKSSLKNLNDIIWFCKDYLNTISIKASA